MKRVHIIGRKNAGKTTLVEDLIAELRSRGLGVGSIKHTHHRHELDIPGKDSYRHRQAGAEPVAILSPGTTAIFLNSSVEDPYGPLEAMFRGSDIVLVEGNSQTHAPKLEVWRSATGTEPMALADSGILAVVTDDALALDRPIWKRSDVQALAQHVLGIVE